MPSFVLALILSSFVVAQGNPIFDVASVKFNASGGFAGNVAFNQTRRFPQ